MGWGWGWGEKGNSNSDIREVWAISQGKIGQDDKWRLKRESRGSNYS